MIPRDTCPNGHDNMSPYTRESSGRCRQCGRELMARRQRLVYGKTAPTVVCGRRFCLECGRWRHLVDFPYRDMRYPGEDRPTGVCAGCVKVRARKERARVKADPVLYAASLEENRFRLERERRARGVPMKRWGAKNRRLPGAPNGNSELLPAGPLLEWLGCRDEPIRVLCARAGVPERRIQFVKNGQAHVSLSVVDRLLMATGQQHLLHEMYPLDDERVAA